MMSSAQVSEESAQPSPILPKHQRAHAQRVAHADQFGARHCHDGKRPFNAAQGVFHAFRDRALQGPRHQVDDAFAVGRALKDRAAFDQFAPQRIGVGDIAVMGNSSAAHGKFPKEGLHVADRSLAFGTGC